MKAKINLVLLSIFLLNTSVIAGDFLSGKLVFKDGKELKGLIKPINPTDEEIVFKSSETSKKEEYESNLIERIYIFFPRETAEYVRLKTYNTSHKKIYPAVWLMVLEKGYTSLYFALVDGGMSMSGSIIPSDKYWFCHRPDEPAASPVSWVIGKINANMFFKLKASKYFSDYLELSEKIKNKTYKYDQINFVVKKYNEWKVAN